MYIDPLGHNPCEGPNGGDPECSPDYVDPDPQPKLTTWGLKMQDWLDYLKVTPAWWNNYSNGWTDDVSMNITPLQLLEIILGFEFSPLPGLEDMKDQLPDQLNNLAHATTHSFYGLCEVMSAGSFCSGVSSNAVLNFVGTLQLARDRYNNWLTTSNNDLLRSDNSNISLANYVVSSIVSPMNLEWRNGGSGKSLATQIRSDHPISWGNGSLYTVTVSDYIWRFGREGQDYFYILSVSQTTQLQLYKR